MDKIKILAIAPYEELSELIIDVARDFDNIDVHTYVADMLDGVNVAKTIQYNGYDYIISRAGTTELIREVSDIPVIDIKLSTIDMMRCIKLAQNYSGKFAIVGYKSISQTANLICEMLQYDVIIKTISDISQIPECLIQLKENGISLIVGDVITITHAKEIGLNTILVTSGRNNVVDSFEEIIKLHKTVIMNKQKNTLIKSVLEKLDVSVISFTLDKRVIYSSIKDDNGNSEKIKEEIYNLIDILIKENEINVIKKIDNKLICIKGELLKISESIYPTFYVENPKAIIKPFDDAISYKNNFDSPNINLETFSTSSSILKNVINNAKKYATLQTSIIIYGDRGTGKDSIAYTIYQNSNYHKKPLILINSKYMNEKKWVNIFESENSIFTHSGITIYIKNLHLMDENSQRLLESYIRNTSVNKRNRFIFSCSIGYSKSFDNSSLLYFLRNELNSLPLIMPNLNERAEDIPSLVSLYLNNLNLKYGKQVIGFEKEAMKLIKEYIWVDNLDQFKRVIEELIILTDTFYINAKTVKDVLDRESLPRSNAITYNLDLNKSLDDINKDIINLVLSEENLNQSKAAERLGISRTTLWRKIK